VGSHGDQYGYGNYPFSIRLYAGYSSYKYSGDCKAKQGNWNGYSSSASYAEEATQVLPLARVVQAALSTAPQYRPSVLPLSNAPQHCPSY